MRAQRVLWFLVVQSLGVAVGASVATSCASVNYPTVAFRCNPRLQDACPVTHFCCSDDPAADPRADGPGLPAYKGRGTDLNGATPGTNPIFSGNNNSLSYRGMCVNTDEVPVGWGLQEQNAFNCLVPCNPTAWGTDEITRVCGTGASCCQTVELGERDCVFDMTLGRFRPVRVTDANQPNVMPATAWSFSDHDTHQDPAGVYCAMYAQGDKRIQDGCVDQLGVADTRGFCIGLNPGELCPTQAATYVDACEQLNAPAG